MVSGDLDHSGWNHDRDQVHPGACCVSRNVLELPIKLLVVALRGTIGGLLGFMGFLLRKTRGKSVTELLDAADAENHELYVKMQVLSHVHSEEKERTGVSFVSESLAVSFASTTMG